MTVAVVALILCPGCNAEQRAGLSESQAVAIAREHVVPDARFMSSRVSQYGEDESIENKVLQGHTVWAVRFTPMIEICPPDGSPCFKRPGTITVFVDYFTGEYLSSSAFSPG